MSGGAYSGMAKGSGHGCDDMERVSGSAHDDGSLYKSARGLNG